MANASWFEATNEVLSLAQLDEIEDLTTFNNGPLSKYQKGAKKYIRLAHKHLSVRAYRHFASRRFQFPTSASTPIYELDTGLSPENIRFETFFNVTTGSAAGQNGPIYNKKYEQFNLENPDKDKITSGAPTHWILLPSDQDEESPVHKIRLYPNPDQAYLIEYQAKLHAYELTSGDSKILWTPEYEHVLWEFAWNLLERGLGEGKEGSIAMMAYQAAKEIHLISSKPEDIRKAPRTMRMGSRRNMRQRGWIRSPRSVDDLGNIID